MSTNSVCNHARDNKIGRPQRKSHLFITSMITDRIGLHSVLLPLLIIVIIDIIIIVIVIVIISRFESLPEVLKIHSPLKPVLPASIHHVFCSLSYLVSSHFRLIVTRRKAMYSHETILSVYKHYTNPVQREWFVL